MIESPIKCQAERKDLLDITALERKSSNFSKLLTCALMDPARPKHKRKDFGGRWRSRIEILEKGKSLTKHQRKCLAEPFDCDSIENQSLCYTLCS